MPAASLASRAAGQTGGSMMLLSSPIRKVAPAPAAASATVR
jgi:hypothetical protein